MGRYLDILASADLSHCLKDEGPYQFNAMGLNYLIEKVIRGAGGNYYSILTFIA